MISSQTIARINRILEGLSGCSLDFKPVHDLTSRDWSATDLAQLENESSDQPRYIECISEEGCFGFPVHADGAFAGLAVVKGFGDRRSTELFSLAELVARVVELRFAAESRNESLDLSESRITMMDEDSNVIPMRRSRLERVREMIDALESSEGAIHIEPTASAPSVPLLIEAKPGLALHRVALELHERSGRWAFLALEDLAPGTLSSRESLKELGGVTLYIKDLAALSVAEQLKLAEYLAIRPSGDMPQVIAGLATGETRVLPHLREMFCATGLTSMKNESPRHIADEVVSASRRYQQDIEAHFGSSHMGSSFSPNRDPMIPFSMQLLDPDQAPVH